VTEDAVKPPSTEWAERVGADEPERHRQQAEQLTAIQQDRTQRYGVPGRTFHRKQLLALAASFEVLDDLPAHARHGLFAEPGTHEAWVRLSNGSFDVLPDAVPDIRGFALKVFGVDGPDARDGSPAQSQDFLLIQLNPFGFRSSAPFVALSLAAAQGKLPPPKLPFTGFATERFHSTVPIACGPYAVRVRMLPPAGQQPDPAAGEDLAADVRRRLDAGPLAYEFQLQFFVDEAVTPLEDTSVAWPEDEAPYLTVGRLTIPVGQPADEVAFAEQVERASFAPWNALAEHRPLGEVNRARRVAMDHSVRNRSTGS
jgi:hypothetical protein